MGVLANDRLDYKRRRIEEIDEVIDFAHFVDTLLDSKATTLVLRDGYLNLDPSVPSIRIGLWTFLGLGSDPAFFTLLRRQLGVDYMKREFSTSSGFFLYIGQSQHEYKGKPIEVRITLDRTKDCKVTTVKKTIEVTEYVSDCDPEKEIAGEQEAAVAGV